jgi:hypothetical protein
VGFPFRLSKEKGGLKLLNGLAVANVRKRIPDHGELKEFLDKLNKERRRKR